MLIQTSDIRKLSDFRQNATAHLDRLAESGRAEILTVNGQAKGVVMAPEVFDAMVKKIEWYEHLDKLDDSYADALAGRGKPAKQALLDMKKRLKQELEG